MKLLYPLIFITGTVFCNEITKTQNHKIGIFHPYKYKFSEQCEISTHPIFSIYIF